MKTTAIVVAAIIVLLAVTKPTDQQVYAMLREKKGVDLGAGWVNTLVNDASYNEWTVSIEDYFVYKTIVSKMDGHVIGHAYFNTLTID